MRQRAWWAGCLFSLAVAGTLPAAEPPHWPALLALDSVVVRAESLAARQDAARLRDLAPTLREAARKVANDAPPAGALRTNDVTILQKDLLSLAGALDDVHHLSDPQLVDLADGVAPLLQTLFDAAGIARPAHAAQAPEELPRREEEPHQDPAPAPAPDQPTDEEEDAPLT
jgi:hypothetical protein